LPTVEGVRYLSEFFVARHGVPQKFGLSLPAVVEALLFNRMFIGAFQLGQRLRQLGQKSSFSNFFIVSLATANL
jgi:hypothetical protein